MPVTQPDVWVAPPFEGRLVEQPPFKKVMIGRGTNNSKGGQMAHWNALMAIKAVAGKLPVNLIVVAEGDEERMSIGLAQVRPRPPRAVQGRRSAVARRRTELLRAKRHRRRATPKAASTSRSRPAARSGAAGPTVSDIHGGNKRSVDSPAWRHIKMLSTLVSDDGNTAKIDGFYDDAIPFGKDKMDDFGAAGRVRRHGCGRREPRRGAFHRRRPGEVPARPQLDLVQPGRHLGREHVCRRRGRHPAEQDHVEAQHPLRAEHDRARPGREDQEAARQERLPGRRGEDHRRRAVARGAARGRPAESARRGRSTSSRCPTASRRSWKS